MKKRLNSGETLRFFSLLNLPFPSNLLDQGVVVSLRKNFISGFILGFPQVFTHIWVLVGQLVLDDSLPLADESLLLLLSPLEGGLLLDHERTAVGVPPQKTVEWLGQAAAKHLLQFKDGNTDETLLFTSKLRRFR